jgi:hypothetical protein
MDPHSHTQLKQELVERMVADCALLDQLRAEIRPLRGEVRRIQPRSTTSISLVAADGGNNRLQFDPFLVQLVRVVDSSNNEYCLEAITPTTSVSELSAKQFDSSGNPYTALGHLMSYLGVRELPELSPMIRRNEDGRPVSPSWVQVYRELVEWAILFSIIRKKEFGSDTLILFDGLLRSKVFARDLFRRYLDGVREGIERAGWTRRKLYLVGMAKHSKVLDRYRLAMSLEGILTTEYPAFVEVPRDIEEKAYVWAEYARGDDRAVADAETNKFVGGKMFFVKFGGKRSDAIWPVDIFLPQRPEAPTILGHLLADAVNGFPVPLYPQCLQRAHMNASLTGFDFDVFQDDVFHGLRQALGADASALDVFRLQDTDPAQRRYS